MKKKIVSILLRQFWYGIFIISFFWYFGFPKSFPQFIIQLILIIGVATIIRKILEKIYTSQKSNTNPFERNLGKNNYL